MEFNLKPFSKMQIAGLDIRAIGTFRIALGLLLFWNFFFFKVSCFVTIFAPENGFLGNIYMNMIAVPETLWSPLNYVDTNLVMVLCYGLYFLLIVLFLLGIGGKLTALLILFCLWSFSQRFYQVHYGWDLYLQVLVFIALLLPVNKIYAYRRSKPARLEQSFEFKSPIVYVVLLQIACIYFFNAFNKFGHTWQDGTAAYFIMADAALNKDFARFFVDNTFFVQCITYATLVFEYAIPVLLFFPIHNKKTRLIAIVSILCFHWGISLFANVGHFKFCGTVACILLLPDFVWDKIGWKLALDSTNEHLKKHKLYTAAVSILTIGLCFIIFNQNLANAFEFKQKFKEMEKTSSIEKISTKLKIHSPEFTSLINQSWTLYAPNPMNMTGILDIEFINDSRRDTISGLSMARPPAFRLDNRTGKSDLRNQFLAVKRKELEDSTKARFLDLLINNLVNAFDNKQRAKYHYFEVVYYTFDDRKELERQVWANGEF